MQFQRQFISSFEFKGDVKAVFSRFTKLYTQTKQNKYRIVTSRNRWEN
jgi:hypothetical protein